MCIQDSEKAPDMEEQQAERNVPGSGSNSTAHACRESQSPWMAWAGRDTKITPAMDRQITAALQPEMKPITVWSRQWRAQHSPVGITSRQENIEARMAELHKAKICMGKGERAVILVAALGTRKLAGGN